MWWSAGLPRDPPLCGQAPACTKTGLRSRSVPCESGICGDASELAGGAQLLLSGRGGSSSSSSSSRPVQVSTACINNDGSLAAAADTRGQLHVFDLRRSASHYIPIREGAPGNVAAMCFVANLRNEFAYAVGRRVRVVDPTCMQVSCSLRGHEGDVSSVASGGRWALTQSSDVLILWCVEDWARKKMMSAPTAGHVAAQFNLTGTSLAILYANARVALWTPNTGSMRTELTRLPPVDGVQPSWRQVSVGSGCVVVCADAPKEMPCRGLLGVWHRGNASARDARPAVYETQEVVLQVLVRKGRGAQLEVDEEAPDALADTGCPMLFIGHPSCVCIANVASGRLLLSLEVPGLLQLSVDMRSSRILVARDRGLEWRALCSGAQRRTEPVARGRRQARQGKTAGPMQPTQGPRCLSRVGAERLLIVDEAEEAERAAAREAAHRGRTTAGRLIQRNGTTDEEAVDAVEEPRKQDKSDEGDADQARLLEFLWRHCAYPAKHRAVVWRRLLQLPRNQTAYDYIVREGDAGICSRATEIVEASGVATGSVGKPSLLVRRISELTTWAPALADVPQLPAAVQRFVDLFSFDSVLGFEMCVFFLLQWGAPAFDTFPSPPLESLAHARELLQDVDPELADRLDVWSAKTASEGQVTDFRRGALWSLVQSGLSCCLPQDAWLTMWDHLVARWREGPALLDVAACAVLRCLRETLLALPLDGPPGLLHSTLGQTNVVPAARLVEEFYRLRARWANGDCRLPTTTADLPLRAGRPYPPLLRGFHFVLDYLVLDRASAREEFDIAQQAVREAAQVNEAIDTLVEQELKAQIEQAKTLRAERARRDLARQDDARLEADRRKCAQEAAAARLRRINTACLTVEAALEHEREFHDAEAARLADEMSRRRRRASVDAEIQERELDLADVECFAVKELGELLRRRRSSAAAQKFRQTVRATLMERDLEVDAARRRRRAQDQREAEQDRTAAETAIAAYQDEMVAMQRLEVDEELALDDQEQMVHQAAVEQARAARAAARAARAEVDAKLVAREQALQSQLTSVQEACEARQREAKLRSGLRLQAQRRALSEAQRRTQQSVESESLRLQRATLAEEQARFDVQLRRIVTADETAAMEYETHVQDVVDRMEAIRQDGELHQAELERRQELVTLQDLQYMRAQGLASELLQNDRREFCNQMGLNASSWDA